MRSTAPFQSDDLAALGRFFDGAPAVVSMEDIYDGADPDVIGLRHDCDNVIEPASHLALWEYQRGFRSTYYVLHSSPYWKDKTRLRETLAAIEGYGHEIGIHNDAITVALETGRDPADVLDEAITELRGYGFEIRSTVAHGNSRCHIDKYVNDQMFTECRRDDYGDVGRFGFTTTPLSEFGLDFDANWLHRGDYISDSGGNWSQPFGEVAAAFPSRGQLHMLVHPDHWGEAFDREKAAA